MKVLRTITSLSLAMLVLISSSSFMVGMHFCGGDIESVTLFTHADGCEMAPPPCHQSMPSSCCEDGSLMHEGQDFKTSSIHSEVSGPMPATFSHAPLLISEIIPDLLPPSVELPQYIPPLRCADRNVEHSVFLI